MNRTGFIKEDFDSIEQATRVLNANGYSDTLMVKERGIFSSTTNDYIPEEGMTIHETHRTKSKDDLVRVLFALTKNQEPLGTLSIACGAEHADEITKLEELKQYFKLENQ
jgi:hypothetical protein